MGIYNKNSKIWSVLLIIILVLSGFILIFNTDPELDSALAVSTWTQESDKDFNNGTSTNLTIVGNGAGAKLEIDISDLKHWLQQSPGSSPTSRGYHGGASIDGDDKVVIFGGSWGRDDTWEYDLNTNTWTDQTKSTKPSARYYTTMAGIDGDDKAVLFGGRGTSQPWLKNDTWEYDSSTSSWSQKNPQSFPSARYSPGMATIYGYDKALLFGGVSWTSGWTYFNDTWVYDSSDGEWIQMSPGSAPSGRYGTAMAPFHNTDKVVLYGGQGSGGSYLGETWVYDFSSDTWTNKQPSGGSPGARGYAAMATIPGDDKVVLFGGMDGYYSYFGDTWVYDLSDNTWKTLTTPAPTARAAHIMNVIDGTDKALLFGGMTSWNQFNSETWLFKYRLPTRNGTYISAPYDTGASSDFKSISFSAYTPQNTSVSLQIRTSDNISKLDTKPFLGPDGTAGSYYTSSSSNIWEGHDGDRWIQYIAYLNIEVVDESPSLNDTTIQYNCLPNTIIVSPVEGSILQINKPIFKWTFQDYDSEDQEAFQILIDDDINFTEIEFDSGEQTTTTEQWEFPSGTSFQEIPDGFWYWKVRTKDSDGAWTEFSSPQKICIDTHEPGSAPNYPANNGFYSTVSTIFGVANDFTPGSGLDKIELAINRQSDNNFWDGTKWLALASWLMANGTTDWFYDTSKIEWASGAKYSVQSRAIDLATNIETSTTKNIFTIDRDKPKSIVNKPVDSVWINKLNIISGTSHDNNGAGVNKVELCIKCSKDYNRFDGGPIEDEYWSGTGWSASKIWLKTQGTTTWSFNTSDIQLTTGDYYTILSRATDKTENVEIPGEGTTFMYDAKPPENLAAFINNDDEYTGSSSVILSLQAEDVGSGLSEMAFSSDSAVWSAWEPFNTSRSFELPTGDGKKTIYFRANDFTDNIAEHVSDTILLDTTPPEQLDIVIDENAKYANTRRVKLDLKAIDKLSGVNEISLSYDGVKWLDWEPFNQIRYLNIPPTVLDGDVRIFFKAKDFVENIAEPVSDTIILDTKPPFSLSIKANGGAAETNSTTITLNLQAIDDISGVNMISFSTDGESWSNWEEYSESKSFNLPVGNGLKTIYYRVKDKAENIADPVETTILLNITTPETKGPAKETASDGLESWFIIIIVIIVVLVLVILSLIMVIKRKKRREEEALPAGAVTIRPGGLAGPMIGIRMDQ
ncbi:Kelch repeat-containing protein, partial [[Eubacterium] cellulosolvens]